MKSTVITVLACLFVSPLSACYTYVIDSPGSVPDLSGTQTMLIRENGGDGSLLRLNNSSSVTIEGTSALQKSIGGIWEIELLLNSSLYMSGGTGS